MYLLKKVIQFRENSHPDHEKPFLEHLEDLRIMITRIVITLIVAMIACFAFNSQIMAFFRKPVDEVMIRQLEATLPKNAPRPVTTELWSEARKVEGSANSLNQEQRAVFYQFLGDENLEFHARSVGLLRAAMSLPEARRQGFIDDLPEPEQLKKQLRFLLETKPNTESQTQGNLNMMSALKPTEGFMLSMKLSFVAGIVVSFPLLLLYTLQFVLPGLHSNEKRLLWPAMTVGFGLFLLGACFAYFLVLPRALLFFYQWSGNMGISNDWRIGEYISFATQFTLLFGLSFELPVVVMVFVKLGMLSYETMSNTRSYAILAIFVLAALLTPTPDILTMLLMASPMILLYEICIWLAYLDRKKNRVREEQEARERVERMLLRHQATAAAGDPPPEDNGWHDYNSDAYHAENHYSDDDHSDYHHAEYHHGEKTGDDGWHEAYPQHDSHARDALADFDGPAIEGPVVEGPVIDGPVTDSPTIEEPPVLFSEDKEENRRPADS
ncbi:MAG: twin-arginine translocase subunit TatC [Akkermansiaceae bacterium]